MTITAICIKHHTCMYQRGQLTTRAQGQNPKPKPSLDSQGRTSTPATQPTPPQANSAMKPNRETHLQLEHCVLGVVAYGLNGCSRHEVEQAEDEVGTLAQDLIRLTAVQPELTVVLAVLQGGGRGQWRWGVRMGGREIRAGGKLSMMWARLVCVGYEACAGSAEPCDTHLMMMAPRK